MTFARRSPRPIRTDVVDASARLALAVAVAVAVAAMTCAHAQAPAQTQAPATAADAAWPVAGRQGLIQVVIVPAAVAADRDAYAQQVLRLCEAGQTCFINFFTNTTGAPLEVPLPDAIAREATAIYRHSVKQGAEMFRWSCRMAVDPSNCF